MQPLGERNEARRLAREAVARGLTRQNTLLQRIYALVSLAFIEESLNHTEEAKECVTAAKVLATAFHEVVDNELSLQLLELLRQFDTRLPPQTRHKINSLLSRHAGFSLSEVESEHIAENLLNNQVTYEYPWIGIENMLYGRKRQSIQLFGYGSLLNLESAARTLRAAADGRFTPVLAFGVIRLFNFEMPKHIRDRFGVQPQQIDRGLLNLLVTGFLTDIANGLLFDVSREEIASLREREVGCDLRSVVCIEWKPEGRSHFLAYALSAPPGRIWNNQRLTNPSLEPYPFYLDRCIEGAASISQSFLDFWLETTFLGDAETSLSAQQSTATVE